MLLAVEDTSHERVDGVGLIAAGGVVGDEFEIHKEALGRWLLAFSLERRSQIAISACGHLFIITVGKCGRRDGFHGIRKKPFIAEVAENCPEDAEKN